MLICPYCQFENSPSNKFCQECGTSLTQKNCPECDTIVALTVSQCPACRAEIGPVWLAIVSSSSLSQSPNSRFELSPGTYLDTQQRYQLLEPLTLEIGGVEEAQVRVLDCQPFQKTLLQTALETVASLETPFPAVAPAANPAADPLPSLTTSTPSPEAGEESTLKSLTIPAVAQPYMALQSQFQHTLPELHDAWQEADCSVLLLGNYSHLPTLGELLQGNLFPWMEETGAEDLADPDSFALQILYWLNEIVDLWEALEPLGSCRSLLEVSNLRVDEDLVLHLQQLYVNHLSPAPTLQDLGHLWQALIKSDFQRCWGDIAPLVDHLQTGKIQTIETLRSQIELIARGLQDKLTSFSVMAESSISPDLPDSDSSLSDHQLSVPPSGEDLSLNALATHFELPVLDEIDLDLDGGSDSGSDDMPTVVLPMQLSNVDYAGYTDTGKQRDHNEDYFGIDAQVGRLESPLGKTVHARGVFILCDGMGGHASGEIASALAVDTLRRYFQNYWQNNLGDSRMQGKLPSADVMRDAIYQANKAIYDINQQSARSGSGRMGTTLVMVLLCDTEIAVAHVGDSRLYRYNRKRGLEQVTVDHEVGQREIQRGVDPEIAYGRPDAYQLTQALGPRDENFVSPDVQFIELNEDTLLLLCSDGLTDNNLLENHCQTHIEPLLSSRANLDQGVSQLIELANQYNGHDNITALVIRAKVKPNLQPLR